MNDTALVSITSQGQITIPVKFRRRLGLTPGVKAIARISGNGFFLENSADMLSMVGTLKVNNEHKSKTLDETLKIEKEAIADSVAERYLKKQKRSTGGLYIT